MKYPPNLLHQHVILALHNLKEQQMPNGTGLFKPTVVGLILGFSLLLLYLLATYVVDDGEKALAIRSDKIVRLNGPGTYLKIPLIDTIIIYPVSKKFKLEENNKYLLNTKEVASINITLLWNICDPVTAYKKDGYYDINVIHTRVSLTLNNTLRNIVVNYSNKDDIFNNNDNLISMQKLLQDEFDRHGVCLASLQLKPGKIN